MIQANKLFAPVAAWGMLQLILLGIGASGFALWAHAPRPPESLTLPIVLCGQILISSMLFPVLFCTGWALAINLALMLPFDELAGLLSNTPPFQIAKSWLLVGLWILGLSLWRNYRLATQLATLFVTGGVVLDYLRWEQHLTSGTQDGFRPISLITTVCVGDQPICRLEAVIPLMFGALFFSIKFLSRAGTPLHSTQLN